MTDGPPPPPPPHGTPPKSTGLPPGNYDIFIIPPHASGSGFLYLPSLQPHVNSFIAGFASALVLVALTFLLKPLFDTIKGGGGPLTLILMFTIGLGAWALGRMQSNGESRPGPSQGSGVPPHGGASASANNDTYSNGSASGGGSQTSGTGFSPGSTEEAGGPPPNPQAGAGARQRSSSGWEETPPPSPGADPEMPGVTPRTTPGPTPGANDDARAKENAYRAAWEEARERTRRKEAERKRVEAERKRLEAERKRKEELEKRLKELRAKEALERATRERKQKEEREARERKEREEQEAKERIFREELEAREKRERAAREKEREDRERLAKMEREEQEARERKAKEERETRQRIQEEAEAKARADYDRRLREEVARREVRRKEEEAIRREQEKLRLEAIARVEAEKKARADKERADAEAKAKAEKAKAAAKAWAEAKARAAAKREAKAKEEREKEVAAQIREVKLKEEREAAAAAAAQLRELKLREEREAAAAAQIREARRREEQEAAAAAQIREARRREERDAAAAAAAAAIAEQRKPNTYSNAGVGERISPWPNGKPPMTTPTSPPAYSIPRFQAPNPSPKKPPPPAARTYAGTDKDSQSHSSYAQPPRPVRKKSLDSLYSESSYAASQSTSKTTPPPSTRGPYRTKDPDKIVIKGVFAFNNAFHKTPTSQLLSGVGSVTDGLILRITTEGLFIDDDVRGVAQREWDVKAWTMKLVEVWCPSFRQASRVPPATTAHKNPVRRLWGLDKELAASEEEKDTLLVSMLQLCRDNCRAHAMSTSSAAPSVSGSVYSASSYASSDRRSSVSSDYADSVASSYSPYGEKHRRATNHTAQMGENRTAGLHILRASIRDQEGKKYVFVVQESEAWKVALGLQRLRRGTQVRSLGVSGMSPNDAKATLENLGWI